VSGLALTWRKQREIDVVMRLLNRLNIPLVTAVPEEVGADVVVTLEDGRRIGVEVTEPYLTDDGQSPQARARRWRVLWKLLQNAAHEAGFRGLIFIEFRMEDGWPAMPPSRDFEAIVSEVMRHAMAWPGKTEAIVAPTPDSTIGASVAYVTFEPSTINDISSSHQGAFIPGIEPELLYTAIRKKIATPPYAGIRWLLTAIGGDLYQPIGEPPPFDAEPDSGHVFDRIYLYDRLNEAVFEKAGLAWSRVPSLGSREVQ
jgi:hypothetical protein